MVGWLGLLIYKLWREERWAIQTWIESNDNPLCLFQSPLSNGKISKNYVLGKTPDLNGKHYLNTKQDVF